MDIQKFNLNKTPRNYKYPEIFVDTEYEDYVMFGVDNKLPQQNLSYYLKSTTLHAIIDTKTNMSIAGEINIIENEDEKIIERTEKFLNNINPYYGFNKLNN